MIIKPAPVGYEVFFNDNTEVGPIGEIVLGRGFYWGFEPAINNKSRYSIKALRDIAGFIESLDTNTLEYKEEYIFET